MISGRRVCRCAAGTHLAPHLPCEASTSVQCEAAGVLTAHTSPCMDAWLQPPGHHRSPSCGRQASRQPIPGPVRSMATRGRRPQHPPGPTYMCMSCRSPTSASNQPLAQSNRREASRDLAYRVTRCVCTVGSEANHSRHRPRQQVPGPCPCGGARYLVHTASCCNCKCGSRWGVPATSPVNRQ